MWRLYEEYYENIDHGQFDRDLAEKSFVFLAFDARDPGVVVGFSTAMVWSHVHQGQKFGFLFSGDTIIHPDYWGQPGLQKAYIRAIVQWKLANPTCPLYWLLICSGCRTYLSMARNLPEHWPHFRHGLPAWERGLINAVCRTKFGAAWQPERGVISLAGAQPKLKDHVAPFTDELRAMEEIQFFMKANPDHLRGDELAMIGLFDSQFVLSISWKIFKKVVGWRR